MHLQNCTSNYSMIKKDFVLEVKIMVFIQHFYPIFLYLVFICVYLYFISKQIIDNIKYYNKLFRNMIMNNKNLCIFMRFYVLHFFCFSQFIALFRKKLKFYYITINLNILTT